VGSLPPNAWGLHDLHGALWEWCADAWHASYDGAPSDGRVWQGLGAAPYRVARGGSWHDVPDVCRSAARLRYKARDGDEFMGFRVALV
jgi:formylglycine-generating enzyme required for sulfatase activity